MYQKYLSSSLSLESDEAGFISNPRKPVNPVHVRVEWIETWIDSDGDQVEDTCVREFTATAQGWRSATSFAFEVACGIKSSKDASSKWVGYCPPLGEDCSDSYLLSIERVTVRVNFHSRF